MAGNLVNLIAQMVERHSDGRYNERHGLVSSYDPKTYRAKVMIQPDGFETGWLPIETGHIGKSYGIVAGLQVGNGQGQGGGVGSAGGGGGGGAGAQAGQQDQQGDQVVLRPQEGNIEAFKIVQRVHSDKDDKPPEAQSGEMIYWTKFKEDKDPGPDAAQSGQKDSTGQKIWFKNDGSIVTEDGNGASRVMDGKGNYTVTSGNKQQDSTHIVHQVLEDKPDSGTSSANDNVGSLLSGGNIGPMLGGLLGGGGKAGTFTNTVPLGTISSMLTGLISKAGGGKGAGSAISLLTGLLGGGGLGGLSGGLGGLGNLAGGLGGLGSQGGIGGLAGMLQQQMQKVLHYTKLDRKNGIKTAAFNEKHFTTWDQSGVTHSSNKDVTNKADQNVNLKGGQTVTSSAPRIPHNGQVYNSQNVFTTQKDFASAFGIVSDERLKTNIVGIPSVLNKIMSLKVKTFDKHFISYAGEGQCSLPETHPGIGLIAQELRRDFPELVYGDENKGEFLSIDTTAVSVLLLAAFQEFVVETRAEIAKMKG